MKKAYEKIMIIGNMGSGKTTLAKIIYKICPAPLYHLDMELFRNGYYISKEKQIERVKQIVNQKGWIVEGNYSYTLPIRCKKADLIICVQTNRWVCLLRYIRRWFFIKLDSTRKDNKYCGSCDILDKKVIKLILNYDKIQKKRYETIIKENSNCDVVYINGNKEIDALIKKLNFDDGKDIFYEKKGE